MSQPQLYPRRWNKFPIVYRGDAQRIAHRYHLQPEQLFGDTRGRSLVAHARQELMHCLHTKHELSFTEIGRLLNRYRRTVAYGVKQHSERKSKHRRR